MSIPKGTPEELRQTLWGRMRGIDSLSRTGDPYNMADVVEMYGPAVERDDLTGLSPREANLLQGFLAQNEMIDRLAEALGFYSEAREGGGAVAVKALAEIDHVPAWQPIETAPTNVFVLVACPSGYTTTPWDILKAINDPDYKGWMDVRNDRLSDCGNVPLFWHPVLRNIPDVPE